MHLYALALWAIAAPAFLRVLPGGVEVTGESDAELVARAKTGDRIASDALVARHLPTVLARAERLMGRNADSEDVVQDAFFEALRDLSHLDDPARFGPWVQKIAVHQVHRRFRRLRLLRVLGITAESGDQILSQLVPDHSDPSIRAQLRELDAVLGGQGPRDRLAWMLRHVEGLRLDEVAQHLDISLATTKRCIARVQGVVEETFGPNLFAEDTQ
jgi:RNA polymerase sigma-70 factor, ECF subfamily